MSKVVRPKSGRVLIVQQRFHVRLDRSQKNQPAGRVRAPEAVDLSLEERREAPQRTATTDLELVEHNSDAGLAQ